MGAVCASDINQTDDFGAGSANAKTYHDLNNDISTATSQIELNDDYTFDNTTDGNFKNGISINQSNLVINGNGHVIDAKSQARIFTINASNVTFNNLVFKNAVNTAVIATGSTIVTNNVTFMNNSGGEEGGAVYINNTVYTSSNDKFIDNHASRFGAAIFVKDNCVFTSSNGLFKGNDLYWGMIEVRKSKFNIVNATFRDSSSKYSTALHSEKGVGKIRNSRFINLTSSITAGALAFKEFGGELSIENSTFLNVKSVKNAGAIFADVKGADVFVEGKLSISDSEFINCSSEFGGALLQVSGNLSISDSNFISNQASQNGGAIYTSYADAEISNVLFADNNADNNGGAIFFDIASLTIGNSNFTNNHAIKGGAVYLYDSNYTVSNSRFRANIENIYSIFDGEVKNLTNNAFVDGVNDLGNADYEYSFDINCAEMDYNPLELDLSLVNATYFDLRQLNLVTPAKAQGFMGSCWSFGSSAALESAILKATNRTLVLDISENNVRNSALKYGLYGGDSDEGGGGTQGGEYFLGLGAIPEEMDSYDELGKISKIFGDVDRYYIFKIIQIPGRCDVNDRYKFKEALVKYGVLSIGLAAHDSGHPNDYNNKTAAGYYYSEKAVLPNHEVALVGWDDNFSKDNFLITPPGDGAWIIKNSWGSNWGDDGYYYVSYYDSGIFEGDYMTSFEVVDTPSFDKVYQYDLNGDLNYARKMSRPLTENETRLPKQELIELKENLTLPSTYFNTYKATGNDLIAAIGTYMGEKDKNYTIWISVNGKEVYNQSGKASYMGFEIIDLDEPVFIKSGDNFTVKIESFLSPQFTVRNKVQNGMSYSDDSGSWKDLTLEDEVASIKAYAVRNDKHNACLITPNRVISVTDGVNGYDYQFFLKDVNGTALANKEVLVSFNGKNQTATTDENGWGTVTLKANAEGTYDVKVTFAGDEGYYGISQTAAIKLVKEKTAFVAPDRAVYVKEMSEGYKYSAILKDANGNALANKKVLFIFNGKKHVTMTDENGWATVTLTATAAGTQTVTIKFAGDRYYRESTTTRTINVVKEKTNILAPNRAVYLAEIFNGYQYSAILKDTSSKALANKKLIFTFDGKKQTAVTDENGWATVTLKTLGAGTKTVTIKFEGDSVYRDITATRTIKVVRKASS